MSPLARRPNVVDLLYQLAYRGAYQLMRFYWTVRRPNTHGALVAIWHEGEILVVRNSYVSYHSLPGGYVRRGETGREAALRELQEEVGVAARAEALTLVLDRTSEWEGKRDRVEIFALEAATRPSVAIDHREVVEAGWYPPERALALALFPPLRTIIEQRASAPAASRRAEPAR